MSLSEDARARLWLALSDSLTTRGRKRLAQRHGSAQEALRRFSDADRDLIGPAAWQELKAARDRGADGMEGDILERGIRLVFLEDPEYPPLLRQIAEPPDLLFVKGTLAGLGGRCVAVVGSRRETRYGREQAFRIAKDLAQAGVTVVSGLARGIDTAAHRGALEGKGLTAAVLGSGLNRIYPEENATLAKAMEEAGGAVLSELHPDSEPLAFHFPVRNRIVSGLCHALLLVEAREKSGTLITVGHALDQGREVFALPGQADSAASAVPHRLIREGARLCTGAFDLLQDLGWSEAGGTAGKERKPLPGGLSPEQKGICAALGDEEKDFSELLHETGLPVSELGLQITLLEMEEVIEALPGRRYRLKA